MPSHLGTQLEEYRRARATDYARAKEQSFVEAKKGWLNECFDSEHPAPSTAEPICGPPSGVHTTGPRRGERRGVVVFDLDGTLIDATLPGTRPSRVTFAPDFRIQGGRKEVRLRPGLVAMLQTLRDAYDLCIWTAAPSDYMHAIIAGIDSVLPGFKQDLALAFSEEEAEFAWQGRAVTTKDLRKVSSRLALPIVQILVVMTTLTRTV